MTAHFNTIPTSDDARRQYARRSILTGAALEIIMSEKELPIGQFERMIVPYKRPDEDALIFSIIREFERQGVISLTLTKMTYRPAPPDTPVYRTMNSSERR